MASIVANNSASVALDTLRGVNARLDETSERATTGKKPNSAVDGAAYWNIGASPSSSEKVRFAYGQLAEQELSARVANVQQAVAELEKIGAALQAVQGGQARSGGSAGMLFGSGGTPAGGAATSGGVLETQQQHALEALRIANLGLNGVMTLLR